MDGDSEAFYELMSLQKERMYRIAYAYFKNEDDAIEAIQETAYRAWKTFRKLREPRYASTWLIRILLNCCNDERKRKRRLRGGAEREVGAAPSAEGEVVARLDMTEAMERLKPKYREVLLLKYYEDMTLGEIAAALGRPVGTVKARLHKALALARAIMSEGEGER